MTITYIDHFSPSMRMASERERERASRGCTARCCCFPCPHRRALMDLALLLERQSIFLFPFFVCEGVGRLCHHPVSARPGWRCPESLSCGVEVNCCRDDHWLFWRWSPHPGLASRRRTPGGRWVLWCTRWATPAGPPFSVVFVTCFPWVIAKDFGASRRDGSLGTALALRPAFYEFANASSIIIIASINAGFNDVFLHATVLLLLWLLLLPFTIAILFLWLSRQHLHSDCQWWREVQLIPSQGGWVGGSGLARPAVGISSRFLYVLCKKEKVRLLRIVSVSPL